MPNYLPSRWFLNHIPHPSYVLDDVFLQEFFESVDFCADCGVVDDLFIPDIDSKLLKIYDSASVSS